MITDSSAQVWAETRARPKRANPTVWRSAHNSRLETREKRLTVNHESRISQYANWESVSSSTAAPSSSSSSSSLASQTQPFSGPLSSIRLTKWSAFNEPPIPMHRHPLLAVLALRSLQPRLSSAWRYCRLALQMAQRATCIDKVAVNVCLILPKLLHFRLVMDRGRNTSTEAPMLCLATVYRPAAYRRSDA